MMKWIGDLLGECMEYQKFDALQLVSVELPMIWTGFVAQTYFDSLRYWQDVKNYAGRNDRTLPDTVTVRKGWSSSSPIAP